MPADSTEINGDRPPILAVIHWRALLRREFLFVMRGKIERNDMAEKPKGNAETLRMHGILVERILLRLDALHLSETEAARISKVGRSFISDIVSGRVIMPRPDRLAKLAVGLQTSVAYLTGKENAAPPANAVIAPNEVEPLPLYASQWCDADGFFEMTFSTGRASPVLDVDGAFAVIVPDNSNAPRYRAGEIIFASTHRPIAPGAFVVIRVGASKGAIREVMTVSPESVEVRSLASLNTKSTIRRADVTLIARITASREA